MVLLAVGITMAQTYTLGSGLTGIDKLGAHQNGGKGCVGCHTPHSGAFGEGGNAAQGGVVGDKTNAGNYALWGQDLGPLYEMVITQGDKVNGGATYTTTLPAQADFYNFPEEIPGIMMCLSCHDGNVAKGAMMTNKPPTSSRTIFCPRVSTVRAPSRRCLAMTEPLPVTTTTITQSARRLPWVRLA